MYPKYISGEWDGKVESNYCSNLCRDKFVLHQECFLIEEEKLGRTFLRHQGYRVKV